MRPGRRAAPAITHLGPPYSATPPAATTADITITPHSTSIRPCASSTGTPSASPSTATSARKSNQMLSAIEETQSSWFTFSPRFSNAQYINSPARAGSMSTNMFRASVTPNIRPRPGSGVAPAPASNKRYRAARNHPCSSCAAA